MSKKIKATAIEQEVRSIAEKNPDFVYRSPLAEDNERCVYIHNGKPSCIVGQALVRLGVDKEFLHKLDTDYEGGVGILEALQSYDEFEFDDKEAADLVAWSQHFQDTGIPWGEAVERAARMAERKVEA